MEAEAAVAHEPDTAVEALKAAVAEAESMAARMRARWRRMVRASRMNGARRDLEAQASLIRRRAGPAHEHLI
jgi:hypothetical protein